MARKIYVAEFLVSNGKGKEEDLPRLQHFADYLSAMVRKIEEKEDKLAAGAKRDVPWLVSDEVLVTGRRRVGQEEREGE